MSQRRHNPEKRAWKGKSYKKGGRRGAKGAPTVRELAGRPKKGECPVCRDGDVGKCVCTATAAVKASP